MNLSDSFNPQPKPEKQPKKAKKPLKRAKVKKKTTSDATRWKWFSIMIRLRDADENGYCRCITTGKIAHWRDMDAGHFISRRHKATKYDEKNVYAQSRGANRFNQGMQFEFGLAIDRIHGKGTAEFILAKSRAPYKENSFEVEQKLMYYMAQAQKLAKQKGQTI